jgi:hypothetical protein
MSAVAAEALAKPITFEFKGEQFAARPSEDWGLDAIEAFEDGKLSHLLRAVLVDGDYDRLRALKPKLADLREFGMALQRGAGMAGN